MKIINQLLFLLILMLFSVTALAEKPTCEDLDEMASVLDQVAEAFEQTGEIREGGEIDNALGELVEHLFVLAEVENESDLSDYVESMANGWDNMDADRFANSLDGVIGSLDRLYRRDCE